MTTKSCKNCGNKSRCSLFERGCDSDICTGWIEKVKKIPQPRASIKSPPEEKELLKLLIVKSTMNDLREIGCKYNLSTSNVVRAALKYYIESLLNNGK